MKVHDSVRLALLALFSVCICSDAIASGQQSVQYRGLIHNALNDATLQLSGEDLIIGNIGSSGDDGVMAELGRAIAFEAELLPIDPGSELVGIPDSAFVQIRGLLVGEEQLPPGGGTGEAEMMEFGRVRSMLVTSALGTQQIAVEADFGGIGALTHTVKLYLGNTLVASASGIGNPVAIVDSWPLTGEFLVPDEEFVEREGQDGRAKSANVENPAANLRYGGVASVLIVEFTGEPVLADRIMIIAENETFTPNRFGGFEVTAKDIPEITIVDENPEFESPFPWPEDQDLKRQLGIGELAVYPNPAPNGATRVFFRIAAGSEPIDLSLYDSGGRRVRTLRAGRLSAGTHEASWDGLNDGGRAVAAGTYFLRYDAGARSETRRVTLVR